ncbi:MAG: hypothetical protein ABSC47_01055 [Terracidiphilus sp.]
MIFTLLPIAAIAVVAIYIGSWRAGVRRRNAQTWDSLLARLRPDCSARELSDHFLWNEGLNATPEENWRRIQGAHGLWTIYENARVMLEMADYAARNCDTIDRDLIETLRSDAMHIRVCVLMALVQYAFCQVNERICVNAFRAATMYTGMAARMNQLLQQNAMGMVPDLVAAM